MTSIDYGSMDTNAVCKRIKSALVKRGLTWVSVKHDTGTAYGWLNIGVMPSKQAQGYHGMNCEQLTALCDALGFDESDYHRCSVNRRDFPDSTTCQVLLRETYKGIRWGHNSIGVMDTYDAYKEFIDRAEGRTPSVYGVRYWD
jgi:hypothetical protein